MEKSTKRQKRNATFNAAEKMFAAEVKKWPAIWDLADRNHNNRNAIEQAWNSISSKFSKPVSDCKLEWTSLRERYRYHAKVSNSSLEEPSFDDSDYEISEDLLFLPSASSKRKTFTTPIIVNVESMSSMTSCDFNTTRSTRSPIQRSTGSPIQRSTRSPIQRIIQSPIQRIIQSPIQRSARSRTPSPAQSFTSSPAQSNTPRPSRSPTPRATQLQREQMWSKFNTLLDRIGDIIPNQSTAAVPVSPFKEAFDTFDWLLQKLPRTVADQMCLDFTTQIIAKIGEQ